ncbi:tetratricopeptide repeat protein [Streptomyces sp. NBC_00203]|uniref:tetratricopeptide repeat protein n=1 Tax=Streptomyces sp. NBC_00203 TaxID=2975680 RepID=UPI00325568DC
MTEGGTAMIGSTGAVLAGTGGVGKTQLAADYARSVWRDGEVDLLLWITAQDATAVVSALAQAGVEVLGVDPTDPGRAAAAFLAWLEPKAQQQLCRWLIVLDDVADPADLRGLWPPSSPYGHTLVTTRRKDAALTAGSRRLIEVGVFGPAESLAYLTDALKNHRRNEPDEQLAALADDLGHLPLALAQAAAYIDDADVSCARYRGLLADRTRTLADAAPDTLPDGQTHPTAVTWSLSIDRADALRPAGLARPLLFLAAFLDPNGIPDAVLISPPTLAHLTDHHGLRQGRSGQVTADQVQLALRALHRLSLVDYTSHGMVRVHQLVQRAVRDTLLPAHRNCVARTAGDALLAAWPDTQRDSAFIQAMHANTTALMTYALEALHEPDLHPVLFRVGDSLGESGQVAAAVDHYHHLVGTVTHSLGGDHPATLAIRHSIARWRGDAGDVSGAARAAAELLGDRLRVLGPDHPDTLATRHNLAHWQGLSGDAVGAAAAFAELLKDRLRVLGPDHPRTLTARSGLAHWQGQLGNAVGTAAATAELLEDCLRTLGPDHPQTLTTRNSLARWRGEAGDVSGAARATAELLQDRLRILGPNHPQTLTTRSGLARWQGEAGDVAGAAVATADVLDDCLRVLGPRHPLTFITRAHLARWQGEAGDSTGAVTCLIELLDDCRAVLGPNHQHTQFIRESLAHWESQGAEERRRQSP